MIKRRFYRLENADRDDDADSSSSSDSELEGQATEDSEDESVAEVKENDESCSTSSGYECEDSSKDEITVDSSGLLNENDAVIGKDVQIFVENQLFNKQGADETKSNTTAQKAPMPADFPDCILKIKSVFRCRICPRIVCLSEETLRAHLNSKRHARSEKLLKEHRLKAILNDDGEIESQETAAEMNARIVALAQNNQKNKSKRQHRRRNVSRKENMQESLTTKKSKQLTLSPAKKRRKGEN